MDIKKETARIVGDAIKASGKTVTDVATAAAMPRQTLSRRLTGEEKSFTATELYAIANTLGLRISDLLPAQPLDPIDRISA